MKTNRMTEVRPAPTRCAVCPVREKALFQVIIVEYLLEAESRRTGQYKLSARGHLFEEGAPATMAYTLFSGWLMLYRSDSEGARQGLRVALPGDFVGYAALTDGLYGHGALAITDAVVCGFRQADLHAMLDRDAKMARHITGIQARYLATCESKVLGLGRKSAEQRIAHLIAELFYRLEPRAEDNEERSHSMPFPLTQEMLGELTGLTPVHTNRVLRRLRADGVMVCERQRVAILDLPRLLQIGEFSEN